MLISSDLCHIKVLLESLNIPLTAPCNLIYYLITLLWVCGAMHGCNYHSSNSISLVLAMLCLFDSPFHLTWKSSVQLVKVENMYSHGKSWYCSIQVKWDNATYNSRSELIEPSCSFMESTEILEKRFFCFVLFCFVFFKSFNLPFFVCQNLVC